MSPSGASDSAPPEKVDVTRGPDGGAGTPGSPLDPIRRTALAWTTALDAHDAGALEALYGPRVRFYGRDLTHDAVISLKRAALGSAPAFRQKQVGDASVWHDDAGVWSAWFQKRTTTGGPPSDVRATLVMALDDAGLPRIVEETDDVTVSNVRWAKLKAHAAEAKARADECERTARQVVESLPDVHKREVSLRASIAQSGNPALTFGGFAGPGQDDVGFNASLGIDGPERFESYVFYSVDGEGKLTVSVDGDLSVPPEALRSVARACVGYDYGAHYLP